jgi:hypothetical protein
LREVRLARRRTGRPPRWPRSRDQREIRCNASGAGMVCSRTGRVCSSCSTTRSSPPSCATSSVSTWILRPCCRSLDRRKGPDTGARSRAAGPAVPERPLNSSRHHSGSVLLGASWRTRPPQLPQPPEHGVMQGPKPAKIEAKNSRHGEPRRLVKLEKQVGTQDRSTISRWTIVICSPTRFFLRCDKKSTLI